MSDMHSTPNQPSRWLCCVAAPREVRCVLDALGAAEKPVPDAWECVRLDCGIDLLCMGVGKSNASGATARFLDSTEHRGVLSVGIAGSLPGSGLSLGDSLIASSSVFADEGIGANTGFIPMSDAGFGAFADGSMGKSHDEALTQRLMPLCERVGVIATVSWCSGSDGCADGVVQRTGAIAEAMEGAAVMLAASRVVPGILTGEIRVISNTTGDRSSQRWAIDGALERLGVVLGRVRETLD